MNILKSIFGIMRLPFLVLAPACVIVGVGTAYWQTRSLNGWHILLVLIGAVASHISVNAFNEVFDFMSGLDKRTQRTPFSGGSGTLPAQPGLLKLAWGVSLVSLVVIILVGLYFVQVWGWELLPLGLLGVIVVIVYTPWFTHNPLLCLIAPGLGFGVLMVMGTHFALTGTYTWTSFVASLIPFFLVSNLLLLNQFPDVEADQSVGRKHFPIQIGRKASSVIYNAFLGLTFVSIVVGVIIRLLPPFSLLGLLALALAIPAGINAYRYAQDVQKLAPSMGMNVLINLVTPILVALGLFIS